MKIYIFGSNGMLGNYVYDLLKQYYTVIPITRKEYDIIVDPISKLYNVLKDLMNEDVVINCTGLIPQNNHELREYIKVNSIFPNILSEICNHFIQISTDCVFSGIKGNYDENDLHDTTSYYGISKSLGENDNMTIIRTSIIGEELNHKKSLLEWVLKQKYIKGYSTQYWNGITCYSLAKYIKNVIDTQTYWKGVRHLYSEDIVSKYELCKYIRDIYQLDIEIDPVDECGKNMTLTSKYTKPMNTIYNQVLEQYELKYGKYNGYKRM